MDLDSPSSQFQNEHRTSFKERLSAHRTLAAITRLEERVKRLSKGDRVLFYFFATLFASACLYGLYALQQSLLVTVPAYGGTLVEGAVGSPQFINPLLAISDADNDLSALSYAGLMGVSNAGSLMPVLAESYEMSPDGKTYTFTLRDNALFSDGRPVTAQDVVFTIQKAQDPGLKSPRYADWAGVSVSAIDSRTVQFSLSKPYAPFLGLTTIGILPERLWKNVANEQFPFSTLQVSPVGAGPFVVSKVTRDASGLVSSVHLVANKYYAPGRPYLDAIHFKFYSRNEDLADAVRNGDVESAYDVVHQSVLTAPYARVFGVFFNSTEKPVLARLEVRKALSLALDREYITNSVLGGYATPVIGPVPPGDTVKPTPVPQFENPTAEAARILEASGWAYNGTSRVWENTKAKQTLDRITIRTSNVPELKNVASAVKTDWEKLGITVTVELYELGDLSQAVIRPREYEALLYGMVIGRDQDLYAFWSSQERNSPGLNIALYANKTVDTLLEDARSSTSVETRTNNLQKIEDIIAAEYPAAFAYAPSFIYAVPQNLRGVQLPQIITPADRFASVATWYRSSDKVWPFFVQ